MFLDPARSRPRVVGHRGASVAFRENTMEAFTGAIDLGADGLEFDVRRSADDVLVVHHDAHLDDGRMIRQLSADELPDYVPTLVDVLDGVGDTWLNIEVKNHPNDPDYDAAAGISIAVAALIDAFGCRDRVLVSSFDLESLMRLREVDPTVPLGWLVWAQADPGQLIGRAEARKMAAINPHHVLVDASFVDQAHRAGLEVSVWTVDDPERIRSLAGLGVDTIITNTPDQALAALGQSEL